MLDVHFDERAVRFSEKIYGSPKGALRLAVLQADLADITATPGMKVLDLGAGLGHMSLWLAQRGHDVSLVEPSERMLAGAQALFANAGCGADFQHCDWQHLDTTPKDLILCHAVLEWLAEPTALLQRLHDWVKPGGWLSLAFYNRDALIYRNLLKGHFRKIRSGRLSGEGQGLTPSNPVDPESVAQLLEPTWRIHARSGIRIFHDYMAPEFQARTPLNEVLEMELRFRHHPTYAGLGRYQHWLCQRKSA